MEALRKRKKARAAARAAAASKASSNGGAWSSGPGLLALPAVTGIRPLTAEEKNERRLLELCEDHSPLNSADSANPAPPSSGLKILPVPPPSAQVPRKFTSVEDWPKQTDVRCLNCTLQFSGVPWTQPEHIIRAGDPFPCRNVFCAGPCQWRWIDDTFDPRYKPDENAKMKARARYFASLILERPIKAGEIQPAPSRSVLTCYGGDKTPAQFAEEVESLGPLVPGKFPRFGPITR